MLDILTDSNFLIYCAQHYDNPQCTTTDEFLEDLKRIKYIKKLITRYEQNGELKERLILNHIIVLCNLFGAEHLSRILYLKMREQFHCVKPFLVLLNVMPERIHDVLERGIIDTTFISMDQKIIDVLRKINNEAA